MPVAPRQGRKGGKISSSPAVAAADSPSSVSPSSLPPSGAGAALPADPSATLQFNIEALMSKKRRSPSKTKASASRGGDGAESPSSPTADNNDNSVSSRNGASVTAAATTENLSTAAAGGSDTNVFKFDLDAIAQVGQGVVFGGNKSMRTDYRKPETDAMTVSKKLRAVIEAQSGAAKTGDENKPAAADALGLTEASSEQVVLLHRPFAALRLAIALSAESPKKVLVVLPHYEDVADVAAALRAMDGAVAVGELNGQSFSGNRTATLWVTDADTALVYLTSQRGMAPFTHLILPNLRRMTPLLCFFLWGVRERVYRQSANLDTAAPPLHLIVCASGAMLERMKGFFAEQAVVTVATPAAAEPTSFSYDEANTLAETDVLDMAVDQSGKFPGPHRKLVDHTVQVAAALVRRVLAAPSSCPQAIYIFTGDAREMLEALHKERLTDTVIYAGRFPSREEAGSPDKPRAKHRVCVLHSVTSFTTYNNEEATFVLDMATTRRMATQNKSEGFMASSVSEWATKPELVERRELLGSTYPGAYLALYPPAAEAVLPTADNAQPSVYEVEDAVLQCSRARLPLEDANERMICPIDAESMEQVKHSLSEKCFTANLVDVSLTFIGEVASRLPLEVDLSHFVINCCILGHGEAGVVIAAVCALPYRFPIGDTSEEVATWGEKVLESRIEFAGDLTRQSDVLADALVFLEWWRLRASGSSTAALVARLQVKEERLEHIRALACFLRVQVSDYAFLDDLSSVATLTTVTQSIRSNASIFTFFEAVVLARRLFFVRDAGAINRKDRAGALLFVRTAKKIVPNTSSPSAVQWESGAALVAVDLRNLTNAITCARVSAVTNTYLFAALLLLYPQVEYSAPTEIPSKSGRVVFFGITCNRQMKRFRVSVTEAAQILDFREKWNRALGYLQALRTSKKPLSRRKFNFLLKEGDRHFDLEELRVGVQRDFQALVTEVEVGEHQASFTTMGVHCLAPKQVMEPVDGVEASDVDAAAKFHEGDLWTAPLPSPTADTPATLTTTGDGLGVQSPVLQFPTAAAGPALIIDDDEDDEVEVMGELYFNMNGPIIDDDEE